MGKKACLLIFLVILLTALVAADPFEGLEKFEYYYGPSDNFEWIDSSGGDGTSWQTFTVGSVSQNISFDLEGVSIPATNFPFGQYTIYTHIFRALPDNSCDKSVSLGKGDYSSFRPDGWINISFQRTANLQKGGFYCLYINSTTGNNQGGGWSSDRSSPTYSGGSVGNDVIPLNNYDALFELWGVPIDITTIVRFPANNEPFFGNDKIDFNYSVFTMTSDLTNTTLLLWNSSNNLIYQETKGLEGSYAEAMFSVEGLSPGSHTWNAYSCGNYLNSSRCAYFRDNLSFLIIPPGNSKFNNLELVNNLSVGNNFSARIGFFDFIGSFSFKVREIFAEKVHADNLFVDKNLVFDGLMILEDIDNSNKEYTETAEKVHALKLGDDDNVKATLYESWGSLISKEEATWELEVIDCEGQVLDKTIITSYESKTPAAVPSESNFFISGYDSAPCSNGGYSLNLKEIYGEGTLKIKSSKLIKIMGERIGQTLAEESPIEISEKVDENPISDSVVSDDMAYSLQ